MIIGMAGLGIGLAIGLALGFWVHIQALREMS